MGTISSSVGLVSGINSKNIIDQLMQIEAKPQQLVQKQVAVLQTQQTAFTDINAKLLVLKLAAANFTNNKVFQTTSTTSSNSSVLTATSSSSAVPGSYSFTVDRLVSTQQLISRGFADTSATAVGAGDLTFEFGDAKLDTDTKLSQLNGGAGVTRGKIRITDRSGSSATVDLSKALTVNDVIKAVNNTSGINVTASIDGDKFVLTDNTGATTTNLSVGDVLNSGTSASLGWNVAAVGNALTGTAVNTVGRDSLLNSLNDGNGVHNVSGLADLRFTKRDGTTFDVDLDGARTLGAVIDKINTASGGSVTAAINSDKTGLTLTDATPDGGTPFAVTAINGSTAVNDLGIGTAATGGSDTISGQRVIAALNSKLITNLKGGSGATLGTIRITNRAGTQTDVDLSGATSVSQLLKAINGAGAGVTAALDTAGTGITLTDTTGSSTSNLIVADVSGTGATDLGLAQSVAGTTLKSGNLQFRYITEGTLLSSLNGGQGISRGKFKITDSGGTSAEIDLSQGDETTIDDVLREINSRGLQLTARINDNGDGILLDDTGPGTLAIKVEESGSTTAKDLGILGSASTAGADLNGSLEKKLSIAADDTLDDIVTKINDASLGVRATIINDGSGANQYRLSLTSTKTGKAGQYVFNDGGLDLGLTTLVEAQDAVVFYGSTNPAKAVAITSATNTLNAIIPGATVNLVGTSEQAVTLTINRDDTSISKAIKDMVTSFNNVIDTLNKYDTYDADTKTKGLLLGDSTVNVIRNGLYRYVNNRNTDVSGQFFSLSQIGITISTGAKLSFDDSKFSKALTQDRSAVEQLMALKVTTTDSSTNKVTLTKGGFAPRMDELLDSLTRSGDGTIASRTTSITSQITLGNERIGSYTKLLATKRTRLETQFNNMELALSKLQSQGNSLTSYFSNYSTSSG